jgi:hypothetical protein
MAGKTTDMLTKAATEFAAAKAGDLISNLGEKVSGGGSDKSKDDKSKDDNGGDDNKGFIGTAAQSLGEGKGPIKSLMSGAGAAIKGIFKRKGGSKRPHNIIEDCFVGVTPDVAFAAWTQWEEFASFTKGVENVTRGDETPEEELEEDQHPLEGEETGWTAKIWWSRRTWKANTVDYDPPNRISWKSDGPKGTVDGTITFTAIGENATMMLFTLEYRNKGPIEWIGNRWRTVGRRVRLDIKHFRRYVMRTEPEELPEPEEADEIPEDAKADDQDQEQSEDQQDDQSDEQSEGEGEDQADDQAEEPEDQAGDESGDEEDQEPEEDPEEPEDDSGDEPEESEDDSAEEPDEEPAAKSARRPMPARRR